MNTTQARRAVALAEQASIELRGLDSKAWLERIENRQDDLEAAFDWLITRSENDAALRIATALYDFWRLTGRAAQGRLWIDRVLDAGPTDAALMAEAHYRNGLLAFWQGDDVIAESSFQKSLHVARRLNNATASAVALCGMARIQLRAGNMDEARGLCNEALKIVEGSDDKEGRQNALHILGVAAQMRGDLIEARDRMTQRLELARQLGNFGGAAGEAENLSHVERRLGNLARAEQLAIEALRISVRRGDEWLIPYVLSALAACAVERKRHKQAAQLLGAAAKMVEQQAVSWPPDEAPLFEQTKAATVEALGADEYEAAWSAGVVMSVSKIVAFALTAAD